MIFHKTFVQNRLVAACVQVLQVGLNLEIYKAKLCSPPTPTCACHRYIIDQNWGFFFSINSIQNWQSAVTGFTFFRLYKNWKFCNKYWPLAKAPLSVLKHLRLTQMTLFPQTLPKSQSSWLWVHIAQVQFKLVLFKFSLWPLFTATLSGFKLLSSIQTRDCLPPNSYNRCWMQHTVQDTLPGFMPSDTIKIN